MRPLLPFALLAVACTKTVERPAAGPPPSPVPTVPKATEAELTPDGLAKAMGVPLYPGAEAPDGLSRMPERRADGSTHYSLVLATKDSVDKAAAFYAKALGFPALPGIGGKNIIGKAKNGNDLLITVGPEAGRTLVRIKSIAYKP